MKNARDFDMLREKNFTTKIRYHKFRLNSDTKFDTNPTVDDQP